MRAVSTLPDSPLQKATSVAVRDDATEYESATLDTQQKVLTWDSGDAPPPIPYHPSRVHHVFLSGLPDIQLGYGLLERLAEDWRRRQAPPEVQQSATHSGSSYCRDWYYTV